MTPYAPPMPHHTDADRAIREAAALRRRLVEGAWRDDAARRQADFFAEEVRDMLPAPVLSRNAALQVWGQIATLYDDPPSVEVAGMDATPLTPADLWPMRQQSHLLQVAANECLMRVDYDGADLSYRVVPVDTVVMRAVTRAPEGAAPFNPIRGQPVRVEECRPRLHPAGDGEVWTWEVWDVSDPAAPLFQIWIQGKGADGKDAWMDYTAHYAGAEGWPEQYRDAAGRPVLPYTLHHRRVGDHLREPLAGQEVVSGTLDASALWTMWLSAVRDGAHPQRYLIDGQVPTGVTNGAGTRGVMEAQVVRMNPQTVIQIHGIRRGEEYTNPSAGQWQPAADPASLGTAIESYEAGLAVSAGLSPADVSRGSNGMSGYSIVVSRKGQRDAQKKLIPPSRMGDQIMLAKAAALLGWPEPLTRPGAISITYAAMGISPEEAKAEQEVIKGDLDLGLTSRRAAMRRRNPGLTNAQLDALIAEIEAEKEGPEEPEEPEEMDTEEATDEDAALRDTLTEADDALNAGDFRTAARAISRAIGMLEADAAEDVAEEADAEDMDAEDMPPGSDQPEAEDAS